MSQVLNRKMFRGYQQGGEVTPPMDPMAMGAPPMPPAGMAAPPMPPAGMAAPPMAPPPTGIASGLAPPTNAPMPPMNKPMGEEQQGMQIAQEISDGFMANINAAETPEELMNTVRSSPASQQERVQELAMLVGEEDASSTPDSVLFLIQPLLEQMNAEAASQQQIMESPDPMMADPMMADPMMAGNPTPPPPPPMMADSLGAPADPMAPPPPPMMGA